MRFVAWGFCEVRRQGERQALALQNLQLPCPSRPPGGAGTSGQDALRPTLMQCLLKLSTQSCPPGATSGLAVDGAGRGDGAMMDAAISFRFRLTPGLCVVTVAVSFRVRDAVVTMETEVWRE